MIRSFDTLYLHPGLEDHPRAMELLRRIPYRRLERLERMQELKERMRLEPEATVARGKYSAALAPYPGRMVEGCPATPGMCCCRYRVINLIMGCPFDCSYCILQGYLNRPTIFIYPELEKIFGEVDREIASCNEYPLRFGTGELSDSLALEHFTGFAHPLLEFFRNRPQCWFEFKTKSTRVQSLLEFSPVPGNIVVSWSVNPPGVIGSEERGAPALGSRLKAAQAVSAAGYRLGFHFDPVFHYEGWEDDYRKVVEEIYRRVDPGRVAWISLGTLRYSSWLAGLLQRRFQGHRLLAGELFPVRPDGKYRYPQPLRVEIYRRMHDWIRAFDSEVYVYLCMESAVVYRWALGREVGGDELAVERGFPAPPGWRAGVI
ncbi:MAG: radical SAM protein [Candidatus Glassbacteria bacterium]|nr:radical SAM protein [Candidatus Glassbacteria bacterium]